MYKCFLIFFLVTASFAVVAQKPDTTAKNTKVNEVLQSRRDSVKENPIVPKVKQRVYHPDSNHNPHKALMRSLLIPGWGQIYNHRWWKVPVIYTGLVLTGIAYVFNKNNYTDNLAIAKYREMGTSPAPGDKYYNLYNSYQPFSTQAIDDAVTGYKRYQYLSAFGFIAIWGINIIDAYIDAKFMHTYTMDNDLSFKIEPILMNQPGYASNFNGSHIMGLKFTFALK